MVLDFLPMVPIQIILLDMCSDLFMAAIATDNVDTHELARPQGYTVNGIVQFIVIMGCISSLFDFGMFWIFASRSHEVIQTNWFIFKYFTQVLFFLSARAKGWAVMSPMVSRAWLSGFAISACMALGTPFLTWGQTNFKFVTPQLNDLAILAGLLVLFFAVIEVSKHAVYRWIESKELSGRA